MPEQIALSLEPARTSVASEAGPNTPLESEVRAQEKVADGIEQEAGSGPEEGELRGEEYDEAPPMDDDSRWKVLETGPSLVHGEIDTESKGQVDVEEIPTQDLDIHSKVAVWRKAAFRLALAIGLAGLAVGLLAETADRVQKDPSTSFATPVEIIEATLSDAVTEAAPPENVSEFAPGESVHLWLSFEQRGAKPGDRLMVVWLRGNTEVFSSGFSLPQKTTVKTVGLGPADTLQPGEYTVEIRFNDNLLRSLPFDVIAQ